MWGKLLGQRGRGLLPLRVVVGTILAGWFTFGLVGDIGRQLSKLLCLGGGRGRPIMRVIRTGLALASSVLLTIVVEPCRRRAALHFCAGVIPAGTEETHSHGCSGIRLYWPGSAYLTPYL